MSSIAHINSLPDLCLQLILSKLSLTEQLHNRIICAHWNGVLGKAFLARQALTLRLIDSTGDEEPNSEIIQQSEFHLPFCRELRALGTATATECLLDHDDANIGSLQLSMSYFEENPDDYIKVAPFLVRLFPGIRSLTLISYDMEIMDLTYLQAYLLIRWGAQLGSLTVRAAFDRTFATSDLQQDIIDSLNECVALSRLPALKHLTLEFNGSFSDARDPIMNCNTQLDLPVLGQLETFRFTSCDNLNLLYDSLVKYAVKSPNLRRIDVPLQIWRDDFRKFAQLGDGHFRAKVKQLKCWSVCTVQCTGNVCLDRGAVALLGRAFSSLTSFEVHILEDMTIGQVLRNLLPFNQLIYLKLHLVALYDPKNETERQRSETESTDPDKYDFAIPPQFPTVKVFSIRFGSCDHTHLAAWNLHLCFPMVEAIEVEFGGACDPCGYNYLEDYEPEEYKEEYLVECARKMMSPIKRDWKNLKVAVVKVEEPPEEKVYKMEDLWAEPIDA